MRGSVVVLCIVFLCLATTAYSGLAQIGNVTDVIRGWGYPVEVHIATTTDGFELILHRIPHGKTGASNKGVVLLQHGLTDSSAGYCLNAPTESLPYILADLGYDVWLGNNRGNGYSMNNINYGPEDPRFWDFSWDELALLDFPTLINYVCSTTTSKKISYIGHSEGTIQAFAGLSTLPHIGDQLHVYVALAPVAFVGRITIELFQILARLDGDEILQLLGVREFYLPDLAHKLLPDICKITPSLCGYGGEFFYGPDTYVNDTRLDFYTDFEPFPTSAKNIAHWAQGVRTGTFQRFDYGTSGNIARYNQPTPPPFPIPRFPQSLPLVLVTGGIDGLADRSDVARLISQLPVTPTIITRADYGHLDPILGTLAYKLTYPAIIEQLQKYANY